MTRLVRRAGGCLLLLGLFAGVGCGKGPPAIKMLPVSGTVKLDGKPLEEGSVYFKTAATGAFDQLPIKHGKFEGNAAEGERRVEVTAYRTTTQGSGAMKGEVQESLVSTDYNVDSKLTANVTAAGPNTFTFEVKGK